ncbi:hypothetical protein C4B63_99g59 [Trypanosoma cruzi]|uniref:Uncharacterized protein n=1 Tax=Trypanosoma cruzi TaxID=5693 RepID=A0A2V2USZ5_TRYCR|nr:hypothetical protein C4B63_99g59 [Trypanosoma cruzi]
MTDKALPVTFHTYPRAHRRQGWIPHVCTWNVGALDAAALGFAARYGPHVLCVQEVWQPLLAICTSLHGAAFILLGAPHYTGKGYCCGLATLVRGMPTRGILSFSQFLPAVRNSRTTADTEGCGVSMESAIFTGTFSTAACAHAPTRRTVEEREHTLTVLHHLVTHIVGVPFFLASSTEERTRMQFVIRHCGVSRNGACGAKSEKASDLTQLTDRWITGIVALAGRIIRVRQLKPEARRSTAAVDWEPTRTDATLTHGV